MPNLSKVRYMASCVGSQPLGGRAIAFNGPLPRVQNASIAKLAATNAAHVSVAASAGSTIVAQQICPNARQCNLLIILSNNLWRHPSLPHRYPYTTIGNEELDFRVQDGIGCGFFDIVTGGLQGQQAPCPNTQNTSPMLRTHTSKALSDSPIVGQARGHKAVKPLQADMDSSTEGSTLRPISGLASGAASHFCNASENAVTTDHGQ